jgi:carbonic anhydrase
VIIVGHSECGGVEASLAAVQSGRNPAETLPDYPATHPLNRWLAPLTEFVATLDLSSENLLPTVIDANVKRQVENLSKVTKAWDGANLKEEVWIHGWVYELAEGKLRDLEISRPAIAAD